MKKLAVLLVPLALAISACAGQQAAQKKPATQTAEAKPAPAKAPEQKDDPARGSVQLAGAPDEPIYFDHDSEHLKPESQDLLKQMAEYLQKNPQTTIKISGHCDDTGSSEYNIALGDKRARAAREYLERLGIEGKRIETISYGEEKPAVPGTTDDARSKNRRGEFDVNDSAG